jgi:poly(hydroxyalkanoate) granule-associated protein
VATRRTRKQTKNVRGDTGAARSAWLAGLGAVSIAHRHGGRLIGGLITEGKDFQARALRLTREMSVDTLAHAKVAIAPIRASLKSRANRLGAAAQRGVAVVLVQLGIPSRAEVGELTRRIAGLSRQLKAAK